ncbi:MAG: YfbU family protein [Sporolactobacillus sp.]|uniref:YfbU family protein n=1 Tax=Sporolactobacillus sp. STSJ-5 TaxID=2965076 RepID=UPI00210663A3|nr:YfbU family protein [Sporolactobacillus sp. STSJ-5]MCQ2009389.1 YfbU family protein [Sporolactobacillus sp. STSJ-5]
MEQIKLSKTERLILANQYIILRKLDTHSTAEFDGIIEALINGYPYIYNDYFSYVNDNIDEDIEKKVINVLSMFRSLYSSYQQLAVDDRNSIDESEVVFSGFDGNNETSHYAFTECLINKYDQFNEVKELIKNKKLEDLNSHFPTLPRYNQLLERWFTLKKEGQFSSSENVFLTVDELNYVLGHNF